MNPHISQENLHLLKSLFDRHRIVFWLSWGTCLGAVREQRIMPHDTDIDIDIHINDRKRVIALLPELFSLGFQLLSPRISLPSKTIRITRKGEAIDIFIMKPIRQKGNIIAWQAASDTIEQDFFSHLKQIDFLGEKYNVPEKVIDYLVYCYGVNWKQPILDFWNMENQLDLAGSLSQRELHEENLRLLKSTFDANGMRFWLSKGTCLDAILPRSTACNLRIVLCTPLSEKVKVLAALPKLYELGFEPLTVSSLQKSNIVLVRHDERIVLEVLKAPSIVAKIKGYRFYCDRVGFHKNFFSKIQFINYLDDQYPIPNQCSRYLDYLYGSSFWQDPQFDPFSVAQNITLLKKKIQDESAIEISILETWFEKRYQSFSINSHVLNFLLERIVVTKVTDVIRVGMIVLVMIDGALSVKRVASVQANGRVLLSSDFPGSQPSCEVKEVIIGQVSCLRGAFSWLIPLPVKVINMVFSGRLFGKAMVQSSS
jgi:phosphorylcholine metabolism protein LicD